MKRRGPKPYRPCGTKSAYVRHLRHGDEPCAACKAANTAYIREYRARRRYG
jgi:hypothetical protein